MIVVRACSSPGRDPSGARDLIRRASASVRAYSLRYVALPRKQTEVTMSDARHVDNDSRNGR